MGWLAISLISKPSFVGPEAHDYISPNASPAEQAETIQFSQDSKYPNRIVHYQNVAYMFVSVRCLNQTAHLKTLAYI